MTIHALDRIAMRTPGLDPKAALASIQSAHRSGRLQIVAESLDPSRHVYHWTAPNGTSLFPVVADDGAVITVMTGGMEVTTPTGRMILTAPEAAIDPVVASKKSLAPGVYPNIPDDQYHADDLGDRPSLSNSLAKQLLRSPLHAWTAHPKLNPDWEPTEKKTFDIGRAAHRAVLGKGGDYVAIPESILASNGAASTKEAKAFIEAAREAGQTPLKAEEVDLVEAMAAHLHFRLAQMGIVLDPARSELTALAEIDDVLCRCRVDNAPDHPVMIPGVGPRKVMIDFKTIEDAGPEACRRAVENYGYDFQGEHYRQTWRAACGEDRAMIFVFQEKSAPFEVGCVYLLNERHHSEDFGEDAGEKVAAARALWGECLRSNHWPGYPNGIITIGARSFFRQSWQDKATILTQTSKPTRDALEAWRMAQLPEPRKMAGE